MSKKRGLLVWSLLVLATILLFVSSLTGRLRRVVLLATVLAGPNRPAVAVRRWLASSFRHHPIVVWATALAVFLVLLARGPTAGDRRLLGVVFLVAATPSPSRRCAGKRCGSSRRIRARRV